jgi:uncharacterized protein YdhG (YjbR/CyaY superfamily)
MVSSKAVTVKEYLGGLPADRREVVQAVREVILKNKDKDLEEGMQYGMIGYYVPHSLYPPGYHVDPKLPLGFANLAAQKNHFALYMMPLYAGGSDTNAWFVKEWAKTGKKLDMGKSCIRFKKLEDLALDVIGQAFARITVKKYITHYEAALKKLGKLKKS